MSQRSRFSHRAWWVCDQTFGRWMDTRVSATRIAVPEPDRVGSGPLLLMPNHTSFWDGFLARRAQKVLRPSAPLYTVMLETELERNPFLRSLGGLGLNPGDRDSIRSLLRTLGGLLSEHPDAVVVFFPQGQIWPSFRRPLGFQAGVATLLRALPELTPLPTGLHLEGHNRAGLTAYISVGPPVIPADPALGWERGRSTVRRLESAVEQQIDRILEHVSDFGEDAPTAWPPRAAGTTSTATSLPAPAPLSGQSIGGGVTG